MSVTGVTSVTRPQLIPRRLFCRPVQETPLVILTLVMLVTLLEVVSGNSPLNQPSGGIKLPIKVQTKSGCLVDFQRSEPFAIASRRATMQTAVDESARLPGLAAPQAGHD